MPQFKTRTVGKKEFCLDGLRQEEVFLGTCWDVHILTRYNTSVIKKHSTKQLHFEVPACLKKHTASKLIDHFRLHRLIAIDNLVNSSSVNQLSGLIFMLYKHLPSHYEKVQAGT